MKLGVHVSIAGGLLEAVARAKRLGCTTMQIFSRSPRGGAAPSLPAALAAQFDAARRAAGIDPLAVHGPYIINLASSEAAMWRQSVALLRDEVARVGRLGAQYLVVHVGSHRGRGAAAGIERVAHALNRVMAEAPDGLTLLLENTAGSGQGLGASFEELAAIRDRVEAKPAVAVCLDTAHLFAAGYPIHTDEGLDETLRRFDRIVGAEPLRLIHLNDSKVPFGSRVDRHWHIGQGHIGLDAFRRFVTHPRVRALPMILETPKSGDADDRRNLATVRRLMTPSRASTGGASARV